MSATRTARLLLVEDDRDDQALVRRGFREPAPGEAAIDVVAVETVDAALARLQDESFAIVVTDYTLPNRNGVELLRALQHAGDPTPVVVLTGTADINVAAAALQEGATDFVPRLTLQSAYTVLTATSGEAALQKYAATRPGVVVVDVAMPGMDGPTTVAELRKLGCRTCVALALRGDGAAQELARKAGCVAVVEKPFRAPELVAQIAALQEPLDALAADVFSEDDGYPVVKLDNASAAGLREAPARLHSPAARARGRMHGSSHRGRRRAAT